MHTQVMKGLSIAALFIAVLFWKSAADFQMALNLVVFAAAAVVLTQALQAKKYPWAACFLAIAFFFNPVVPVFRLTGGVALSVVILAIAPFAAALVTLRPHRVMSAPSIMDQTPGNPSL
jgi:hypothetical protein